MDKKKIVEMFFSNKYLCEIEKILNINQKIIRKLWYEEFGKDAVKKRGNKIKFKKNEKILHEFYSTKPLSLLQEEYKLDPRTIKLHWERHYGKEKVENRKYVASTSVYHKEDLHNVFKLVKEGFSLSEISEKTGIKKRTVQKYISLDDNIRNKHSRNAKRKISETMKKMRNGITEETKKEVLKYFDTDLLMVEIAKKFSLCPSSIINIFKEYSPEKHKERVKRLKPKVILKSMKGLEKSGKLGSKREINFYNQLKKRINAKIKHHDYEIIKPYEIDITIPELKIAICWDGIGHFKPIFGEDNFKKVKERDKYKRRYFKEIGWFVFVINDIIVNFKDNDYKKIHDRFDKFLIKIGYGDYIGFSYEKTS